MGGLGQLGFEYDLSIFAVHHDSYDMRDTSRLPHYQVLRDGTRILEFPPATLPACGVNLPVAGGGYFRLFPYRLTLGRFAESTKKENQTVLMYFHLWEIDTEQSRIAAPWRSRFRHYQNLHLTQDKLTRLLDDFSWVSMSEVLSALWGNAKSKCEVRDAL